MNTLVAFFLSAYFVTLVSANETEYFQEINTAAAECMKELNATNDMMKFLHSYVPSSSEAQSCFLDCLYIKMNLIKDGKFNKEAGHALLKKKFGDDKEKLDKSEAFLKTCKSEVDKAATSDEKCGLARVMRKCIVENAKELKVVQEGQY